MVFWSELYFPFSVVSVVEVLQMPSLQYPSSVLDTRYGYVVVLASPVLPPLGYWESVMTHTSDTGLVLCKLQGFLIVNKLSKLNFSFLAETLPVSIQVTFSGLFSAMGILVLSDL